MPPKATVSRQQVLDAALELVRREGLEAMTARKVAGELECSTQPVYRAYRSMGELEDDVLGQAERVALEYLIPQPGVDRPFLQVGLGSLRFAQEEPHLYRIVTRMGTVLRDLQAGKAPPDFVLEQMRADPVLGQLSDEQLIRIHALMWFFSQGLVTLLDSESDEDPMQAAEEYLTLAGRAVIEFEINRRES